MKVRILLLATGVGVLGWAPVVVLIWHFGPPVWAWVSTHPGTVGTVCAGLLLAWAAFGARSRGNGRDPPAGPK